MRITQFLNSVLSLSKPHQKVYRDKKTEKFCGLIVEHPKLEGNVGTLFRTAASLGNVNFLGTIGCRYKINHSDTVDSPKRMPTFNYEDVDDFLKHLPIHCNLVGVELTPKAVELKDFEHPPRAIYLFGAEDTGLSRKAQKYCRKIVKLPTATGLSMNLSAAGSIVLWDRYIKMNKNEM